jgi:hypothetical protein
MHPRLLLCVKKAQLKTNKSKLGFPSGTHAAYIPVAEIYNPADYCGHSATIIFNSFYFRKEHITSIFCLRLVCRIEPKYFVPLPCL